MVPEEPVSPVFGYLRIGLPNKLSQGDGHTAAIQERANERDAEARDGHSDAWATAGVEPILHPTHLLNFGPRPHEVA